MTRHEAMHVLTITRHLGGDVLDPEDVANALAALEVRALATLAPEHAGEVPHGPVAWLEVLLGRGWYNL